MTVDIVGAGIGGLSLAIALQTKGINTRIFEQADVLKPVGAGIILANNAMQVYEKLGLKGEIEDNGNPISAVNITNTQLTPISSVDLSHFEQKYSVRNIAIHRGKLQEILVNKLNENTLFLGYKLKDISLKEDEYQLEFENGEIINSNYLIGADGINSQVRNSIFSKSKIRDAAQVCWRGVTEFSLPTHYQNELNEAWGKGTRFGFVQIEPGKVYWYALSSLDHIPTRLELLFENYDPLVQEIVKGTEKGKIHKAAINDLYAIPRWSQDKVCLIGDAAHATTPNMGQGACQAIEDAHVLADCLAKYSAEEAFKTFQNRRSSKVKLIVNSSWTLGKVAHWSNPIMIWVRDQLMKMTPASISRKQSERIFTLD